MSHTTRRPRPEWDRPTDGTRLLLFPSPTPVSLSSPIEPTEDVPEDQRSLSASFPAADAIAPRMPAASLLTELATFAADACRLLPQMISLGHPSHRASGFAADARVPSPRMITHGSHPKRACPTTVDACVNSQMISRSALTRRRSGCLR